MRISTITNYKMPIYNNGIWPVKNQNKQSTSADILSFQKGTSAGNPLRKLINVTCPYTGRKMILGSEIKSFDKKLAEASNSFEMVELLGKYQKYLQPVEKKIYSLFVDYVREFPNADLQDFLNTLYKQSLGKLNEESIEIMENVDKMAKGLSEETQKAVKNKTLNWREIIYKNDPMNPFKRKAFLESFKEIEPKEDEKELFEKIKEQALFLPTSASSENAFIVKYSRRSTKETIRRIFIASTATIEHIVPASKGGKNDIANFLLTSANGNRYRENMPLVKYIERFKDIPQFCQKYIEDVIVKIHSGFMKGNETYPFQVKKTLEEVSNNKIVLDLSSYKYNEEQAKIAVQNSKNPLYIRQINLEKRITL